MFDTLKHDVQAVFERDPACRSLLEVLLCYPGFHALVMHRLAHRLWRWNLLLLARVVSHVNRFFTGVEIHPAAKIGKGVFIDHGMGVVIGETAEVGDNVTLYQGAVLGGTGKERGKRHPTIGDNVVIAAGAKVLGSFRVGDFSRIGAGAVVLGEVPPHATVVGVPGRVVKEGGKRVAESINLDHANLPDPVETACRTMLQRIHQLEMRLRDLEAAQANSDKPSHYISQ
jgi:serine O-acetyltransferase